MEIKTPTKEQILEAAKSSPEAKKALEKLFPDVFENGPILVNVIHDKSEEMTGLYFGKNNTPLVWKDDIADSLVLTGDGLEWTMKKNQTGSCYYLIPTRK